MAFVTSLITYNSVFNVTENNKLCFCFNKKYLDNKYITSWTCELTQYNNKIERWLELNYGKTFRGKFYYKHQFFHTGEQVVLLQVRVLEILYVCKG